MRIYALADIHGKEKHMAAIYAVLDAYAPDLVVAAGDLTRFLSWRTCLAQLDSLPVPVLAIRGNTDLKRTEPYMDRATNLTRLTNQPRDIQGFSFVGAGGTLVLPFASRICLDERSCLNALPSPMDENTILVVHPPPRGICDKAGGKVSVGSRNLARFIRKAGPGLVLCGHVHEQAGKAMLGNSLVVNCSMSSTSAGAIIDLKKGCTPQVKPLHPDAVQC